jgi:sterol desaturase/sphingolipid hydroxylase (fatty acid hydroxylase superfamily)
MQEYRLIIFISTLVIFFILEHIFSRDLKPFTGKSFLKRVSLNFSLLGVSQVFILLFFKTSAVTFSEYLSVKNIGVLNYFDIPVTLKVVITILFLDFIIYWQHRLFHTVDLLWKIHRVHHSDTFLDSTSAFRFHPVEMVLSMGIKFLFIAILGATPEGVLVFEILLSSLAIFNHSNLKLPNSLNSLLEKIIVTPDFHKVHHSVERRLHDSNYGFNLTLWDSIFRSYNKSDGILYVDFKIGVEQISKEKSVQFLAIFKLPFSK